MSFKSVKHLRHTHVYQCCLDFFSCTHTHTQNLDTQQFKAGSWQGKSGHFFIQQWWRRRQRRRREQQCYNTKFFILFLCIQIKKVMAMLRKRCEIPFLSFFILFRRRLNYIYRNTHIKDTYTIALLSLWLSQKGCHMGIILNE